MKRRSPAAPAVPAHLATFTASDWLTVGDDPLDLAVLLDAVKRWGDARGTYAEEQGGWPLGGPVDRLRQQIVERRRLYDESNERKARAL